MTSGKKGQMAKWQVGWQGCGDLGGEGVHKLFATQSFMYLQVTLEDGTM